MLRYGAADKSPILASAPVTSGHIHEVVAESFILEPRSLIATLLDYFSTIIALQRAIPNMLVFDRFAGSNSTGAAAERWKRRWLSLSPQHGLYAI
jgi:hypothetical protein